MEVREVSFLRMKSIPASHILTNPQQIFGHFGKSSLLKIFIRMRNVNRIRFSKRNQRNKKQLEILFVNGNHGIHLKTISHDFAVFFAHRLFIESKDEKHFDEILDVRHQISDQTCRVPKTLKSDLSNLLSKTCISQNRKSASPRKPSSSHLRLE